jgi:hypothetical protein
LYKDNSFKQLSFAVLLSNFWGAFHKVASDGELTDCKTIESDDLKKANHRKIKTLKSFFGYYESLYKSHKVSMFFLTFTQANMAKMGFSSMLDTVKYRFKSLNIPIRGYLWTSEVSKEKGLHWHYHLCIATDRFIFNNVNDLKFDVQWGQRTQISTVKSVHGITKYLSKRQPKVEGYKNFGKSAQFR